MAAYQLMETDAAVIRNSDNARIPNDMANRDWVEYQKWLDIGGVPDPYVPPEPVPLEPNALAEAQKANARLDAGIDAAASAVRDLPPRFVVPKIEPPPPVSQEQFAVLQAQVDMLQDAMKSMLQAQAAEHMPV